MKRLITLALVAACLFAMVLTPLFAEGQGDATAETEKDYVLKYAGVLPYDHPRSQAAELWGKALEEMTDGRIKVQLYYGGSMGKSTEIVEYVQQGTIAFADVSTAFLSGFDQKFDIFSLPYVFRSQNHMYQVLNSEFGDYMKELLVDDGLRILCFPDSGSRSVYTKSKPVNDPADMEGVKIRVMSSVAVASMNALGANGVPIPWGELYTSLQTGVVDAAENNPPSIISGKHYEVCNFYSLTKHFMTPDALMISEDVYQELPEDLQGVLADSIENVYMPNQIRLFAEATEAAMSEIVDLGMVINEIDDLTPFMELTASVREENAEKIGMSDWLAKIADM
jgi:tripartite ATP-independent transporter DctP family solute receptor